MEFRFENPMALWGILVIFIYAARCLWKRKYLRDSFLWRRALLNSLVLLFCVLGLSRPQGGESISSQVSEQANLYIAIDISQSMLAEDTLPSRIQFSIDFTQRLLDELTQVKVALFPFALDGYMQMPLSSDIQAAKDLISAMSPTIATGQGTDLGAVLTNLLAQIHKAEKIAKARGSEWVTPQVLILSDGESHVPVPDSVPLSFRASSIPIFAVGIGGKQGVPIPIESKFAIKTNLKEPSGRLVLTSAHPEIMQKLADLSGGFFYSDSFREVPLLANRLGQSLQIGKLSTSFKLTREFYPLFFLLGFIALFLDFCFSRWEFAIRLLIATLIFSQTSWAIEPLENEFQAIDLFNQSVSAYDSQNLKEAATQLEKSILTSLDPTVRKKALFNLGNVYLKMGETEQALQAYQQSHDTLAPQEVFNQETNQKISDNLALLERIKEKQQQQKSKEDQEGNGDGKGKKTGKEADPKGPKRFEEEPMSEAMKQKILDHISDEERQTLKRLADEKNKKANLSPIKPW